MSLLQDMLDKARKERDTAIRERDNWRALCEEAGADYRDARAENEKLRAELVDAQKDAKRYRWLTDCAGIDFELMAPYQLIGRMSEYIDAALRREGK